MTTSKDSWQWSPVAGFRFERLPTHAPVLFEVQSRVAEHHADGAPLEEPGTITLELGDYRVSFVHEGMRVVMVSKDVDLLARATMRVIAPEGVSATQQPDAAEAVVHDDE